MASIAYVTDGNMLEYHRFNGSDSIVFWRLSAKKFSDFKKGDLLFFISKNNNTKYKNEKGIVGCGEYATSSLLKPSIAWKKYGHSLGYINQDEFNNAIIKSNKNNELPEKINCLNLDNIIFFQNPIYLSQLGYNITNNLESYTYLDKDDLQLRLLNEIEKIGIDNWFITINGKINQEEFAKNIEKYKIKTIIEYIRINQIVMKYLKIDCENNEIIIELNAKQKEINEKFYMTLGIIKTLQHYTKEYLNKEYNFKIETNTVLTKQQNDILNENSINSFLKDK